MAVGAVGFEVGALVGMLGAIVGAALQLLVHPEPPAMHILVVNPPLQ